MRIGLWFGPGFVWVGLLFGVWCRRRRRICCCCSRPVFAGLRTLMLCTVADVAGLCVVGLFVLLIGLVDSNFRGLGFMQIRDDGSCWCGRWLCGLWVMLANCVWNRKFVSVFFRCRFDFVSTLLVLCVERLAPFCVRVNCAFYSTKFVLGNCLNWGRGNVFLFLYLWQMRLKGLSRRRICDRRVKAGLEWHDTQLLSWTWTTFRLIKSKKYKQK